MFPLLSLFIKCSLYVACFAIIHIMFLWASLRWGKPAPHRALLNRTRGRQRALSLRFSGFCCSLSFLSSIICTRLLQWDTEKQEENSRQHIQPSCPKHGFFATSSILWTCVISFNTNKVFQMESWYIRWDVPISMWCHRQPIHITTVYAPG